MNRDGVGLARRIAAVSPSQTLEVMMEAKALRARGVDVIDFGPGEPDFNTPENIKRAGMRAIEANLSHYTETAGLAELRQAIADRYRRTHGTVWGPENVFTGCGGKNVLFLLGMALFEPGDRVAIYAPYWVSFPEQVRLSGAELVVLPTRGEEGLVPRAADLEGRTERFKAVILNSPCNPSGAVLPAEEVARFAAFAERTGTVIISDETYDAFHYGPGAFASFADHAARADGRIVVVNSFSKTYAMTGWRIGYALGAEPILKAMRKLQSHDATHTAAASQAAAIEAIRGPQDSVAGMRDEYLRRRDRLVPGLNGLRGVTCANPDGAFYAFPDVSGAMRALGCATSSELARRLLSEVAIATVPGEAFGGPGYLRLSYAMSLERIEAGLERLRGLLGGEAS
jgi:aspartate aminotransferase